MTVAEVIARYPGATVEPLPDPPRQQATPAAAAELRALVRAVLADTPQERDDVHRIACADPGAALTCYHELVASDDPPLDPAAAARRQRVLRLLEANPSLRLALITNIAAEPEVVIVTIGIRGAATGEIRIPQARYDPQILLKLMEAHSGPGAPPSPIRLTRTLTITEAAPIFQMRVDATAQFQGAKSRL